MEFWEVIEKRYSVRGYKPDPVEDGKLERVLEAARIAPTAANRQPFELIVIQTRGREEELRSIYRKPWFSQPPLVICAVGLAQQGWVRMDDKSYVDVDVAIMMDHLILAATNEGLGTCWVGDFDPDAARKILGLPDGVEPIAFTPLGYPDSEPRPTKRKPLSEWVRYERW
jgi:nitroreductase